MSSCRPPAALEEYLELVAAVESAAQTLGQRSSWKATSRPVIRGCNASALPPIRVSSRSTSIRPRTGGELVERTTYLYEQAHQSAAIDRKVHARWPPHRYRWRQSLRARGATAPDSPFLRRPDLLRSLVSYWHNHPSLSYLFSGIFIGPTSQAPRADEARNDSLYELEVAFQQLPPPGNDCPPWLVDRLFRNLLTDVTGNTHRAEFCIDKLYSPDGPAGTQRPPGTSRL